MHEPIPFELTYSVPLASSDFETLSKAVSTAGYGDFVLNADKPGTMIVEIVVDAADVTMAVVTSSKAILENLPAGSELIEARFPIPELWMPSSESNK